MGKNILEGELKWGFGNSCNFRGSVNSIMNSDTALPLNGSLLFLGLFKTMTFHHPRQSQPPVMERCKSISDFMASKDWYSCFKDPTATGYSADSIHTTLSPKQLSNSPLQNLHPGLDKWYQDNPKNYTGSPLSRICRIGDHNYIKQDFTVNNSP